MFLHVIVPGSKIEVVKNGGSMLKKAFLLLFIIMNIVTFITVGTDKRLAERGGYRTAEVHLVALSSFGAAPGTMLGFKVFNHKTNTANKGYLWKALWLVMVENLLLYAVVFSRFRSKNDDLRSKYNGKRQFRVPRGR